MYLAILKVKGYCCVQYFEHIEEMEWAIQVCKENKKAVAATMCIGPEGDMHGVSAAECAVRYAAHALIKKETRFSSSIRKFRPRRGLSNLLLNTIVNNKKHQIQALIFCTPHEVQGEASAKPHIKDDIFPLFTKMTKTDSYFLRN